MPTALSLGALLVDICACVHGSRDPYSYMQWGNYYYYYYAPQLDKYNRHLNVAISLLSEFKQQSKTRTTCQHVKHTGCFIITN